MKGLLIKDLQLLKTQKQFYLSIFSMLFIFLFILENPFFMLNYFTVFVSMFTLSTISYDELDNGFSYLFSLPIDRYSYVMEKYIFGSMLIFSINIILLLSIYIYSIFMSPDILVSDILSAGGIALVLAFVFLSLALPIQLKFGAERGKVVVLVSFLSIFAIGFLGYRWLVDSGISLNNILTTIESIDMVSIVVVGIVFCLSLVIMSTLSSLKIMKAKEF